MTANDSLHLPSDNPDAPEPDLSCPKCHNPDSLILESLGPMTTGCVDQVSIEYSCGACESFYAHDAPFKSVGRLLAATSTTSNVLQIGGKYIHCGEPMLAGELHYTTLKVDDDDLADAPAVTVETSVLRCHCGFQMSIPTH